MNHKSKLGSIASRGANDQSNRDNSSGYTCEVVAGNKFKRYRRQKKRARRIGAAYHHLASADNDRAKYFEKRFERMRNCGNYVQVGINPDQSRYIERTYFCGLRLCPGCQSLRADSQFSTLLKVVETYMERYPDRVPMLMTFTARNCEYPDLADRLKHMAQSRHRLRMRKDKVSALFRDSFWSVETTNNHARGEFHPHYHVLCFVDKTYFRKGNLNYVHQTELQSAWEVAVGEAPALVWMNAVRPRAEDEKGFLGAIREVTKYVTKDADLDELLRRDLGEIAETVENMDLGLHGKRVYSFTGELRKIKAELNRPDAETADVADLVNEEGVMRAEGGPVRREAFMAPWFSDNYRLAYVWVRGVDGAWHVKPPDKPPERPPNAMAA